MSILLTTKSIMLTYFDKAPIEDRDINFFNRYYQLGESMLSTIDINQLSTKHSSAQYLLLHV